MSKEPEKKAAEQGGSEIEYAFGRVPADKRKTFSTILVILVGYCISLSNFVTGATVGSKMSFSGTVWSIVVGNAILALVAVMVGIIGAKSGKTTLVLARNFLGKRSSAIMSVLIALSAVNWIAVNADTFANMILTNFKWWPLPVWLTAIIVVAIWAQSAIRGVKGLEIVSWLGAPAAVILAIASFIAIGTKTGFGTVIHYVPGEGQLTFAAGSTSIVGAWIFGCIVTPDVTRYAKNGKHVSLAAPIAVYVGLAMIELVGAMTAQATATPASSPLPRLSASASWCSSAPSSASGRRRTTTSIPRHSPCRTSSLTRSSKARSSTPGLPSSWPPSPPSSRLSAL